jgi:hypothetical protein
VRAEPHAIIENWHLAEGESSRVLMVCRCGERFAADTAAAAVEAFTAHKAREMGLAS